jgi:hypothetical protein
VALWARAAVRDADNPDSRGTDCGVRVVVGAASCHIPPAE